MRECLYGETNFKFLANSPLFRLTAACLRAFAHAAGALMPAAPE